MAVSLNMAASTGPLLTRPVVQATSSPAARHAGADTPRARCGSGNLTGSQGSYPVTVDSNTLLTRSGVFFRHPGGRAPMVAVHGKLRHPAVRGATCGTPGLFQAGFPHRPAVPEHGASLRMLKSPLGNKTKRTTDHHAGITRLRSPPGAPGGQPGQLLPTPGRPSWADDAGGQKCRLPSPTPRMGNHHTSPHQEMLTAYRHSPPPSRACSRWTLALHFTRPGLCRTSRSTQDLRAAPEVMLVR